MRYRGQKPSGTAGCSGGEPVDWLGLVVSGQLALLYLDGLFGSQLIFWFRFMLRVGLETDIKTNETL